MRTKSNKFPLNFSFKVEIHHAHHAHHKVNLLAREGVCTPLFRTWLKKFKYFLDVVGNQANKAATQNFVVSETTPEYNSQLSRLSSIDSLLSDAVSFDPESPLELPDSSPHIPGDEQDDDLWMNQFGKEPLKKTLSSSAVETVPVSASTFGMPVKKKKTSSHSRLETTTYSFSIGNFSDNKKINEDESIVVASDDPNVSIDIEPSSWEKQRDSKDRVPVRKPGLKTVNVRTTISVADDKQQQLHTSTLLEHQTSNSGGDELLNGNGEPHTNNNNNNNNDGSPTLDHQRNELSMNINIARQQLMNDDNNANNANNTTTEHELSNNVSPKSPSHHKPGPTVLPKPKKPLDKKSWTANLIKSKTQKIPEQPQHGSLNEKLLHSNNPKTTADDEDLAGNNIPRTSSLSEKATVRQIRDKFQNAKGQQQSGTIMTPNSSSVEKYV